MPPTNNFLPFCPTDTGTNLLSQTDYAAATDRTIGNQPGVASSKLVNKAARQSAVMTSQIAQYLADKTGADVLDDGTTAKILGILKGALLPKKPIIQKFTTGSSTYNRTYIFTIASGSATAGATYTNNSVTFTVVETVASGLQLIATGSGAPAVSGTLTKASGTGDATLTFYAYQSPFYLKVRMVGGGGGGGSSGSGGSPTAGGTGGTTTFGTSLLTAVGGVGGAHSAGAGGAGGAPTIASPAISIAALTGGAGSGSGSIGAANPSGGSGAASPFGGAGGGGAGLTPTTTRDAIANTGSGGGGGGQGSSNNTNGGSGGGAGAYVEALIYSPSATYDWAVGAAGAASSTAGTNGQTGGAGGSGVIIVEEHYQ